MNKKLLLSAAVISSIICADNSEANVKSWFHNFGQKIKHSFEKFGRTIKRDAGKVGHAIEHGAEQVGRFAVKEGGEVIKTGVKYIEAHPEQAVNLIKTAPK
ncbi:MAG: hypothetical protein LBI30_00075 [Holosporales bacterium]|jgi:hypothetical protein|nr:hypothetical protein [Holosporales bacterium]